MARKKHIRPPNGSSNEERFALYVEPEPTSGCYLWSGAFTQHGHGMFGWKGQDGKYKTTIAHRKAFEMAYGPIPVGLVVCHKCNNPACVNPGHLYAGTQKQNVHDAIRAGTHILSQENCNVGSRNGRAKLTEGDVRDLRAEYADGKTSYAKLAKKYGVTNFTVWAAITGVTWHTVH